MSANAAGGRRNSDEEAWPPSIVPTEEGASERALRLSREAAAKRVSEKIDRQLTVEREERRKDTCIKILLLGALSYRILQVI